MTEEQENCLTQLYRHFAANGELLYVGISLNHLVRTMAHRGTAHWYLEIARIEIEVFVNRRYAEIAEREAIQTEHPRWNTVHAVVRPTGAPVAQPANRLPEPIAPFVRMLPAPEELCPYVPDPGLKITTAYCERAFSRYPVDRQRLARIVRADPTDHTAFGAWVASL